MDNFANIGKAVLIQSIGLQKNYIEVKESETSVIDYNNAACTDCKYKAFIQAFAPDSEAYLSACETCRNCPHKIFTQKTEYKKIYHNETNRFGYKPRLKTNAIKLLLLLHFYHPDRFGIIKNIDIRELAEHLHCDIKTVKNNLEILNRYAYVTYARTDSYIITLCLNDYTSYYLPARQGGRGFIVLSKKLLSQILEIDTLVTLRIYLRQLISIDNLNAKGGPFTAISNTYKDLKRFLPEYCKPNNIRKAVQTSNDIFTITLNTNGIRFEIKDGKIIKAAANDNERINQFLDTDEGARYFGEFAIGVNPYILNPMKDTLFDEKIAGSFHLTPGMAYEDAPNGNDSAVHWDLVMIQRPEYGGGEIYFDDVLIRKDGLFTLPELMCLNPENLK